MARRRAAASSRLPCRSQESCDVQRNGYGFHHGRQQQASPVLPALSRRISVFEFDWETQVCYSPHKETTRTIALSFCDGMKNGWIGRRMPRLFKSHGITDIVVKNETLFVTYEFLTLLLGGHVARLHDSGVLSREDANQWWTSLAAADRDGTFLYAFTAFIVSGTKA